MTKEKYTITLETDPETGDLMMPFPPELLNQMGWDIGDTLIWEEVDQGKAFSLRKKDDGTAQ